MFVAGLSNGAFMTSSLACAYSDRIAAASPVAGITDPEGCEFERPVPVIAFHGTEDTFVAFDGGLGSSVADLPQPDGSGTLGDEATPEDAAEDVGPTDPRGRRGLGRAQRLFRRAWPTTRTVTTPQESIADDVAKLIFACPPGRRPSSTS